MGSLFGQLKRLPKHPKHTILEASEGGGGRGGKGAKAKFELVSYEWVLNMFGTHLISKSDHKIKDHSIGPTKTSLDIIFTSSPSRSSWIDVILKIIWLFLCEFLRVEGRHLDRLEELFQGHSSAYVLTWGTRLHVSPNYQKHSVTGLLGWVG